MTRPQRQFDEVSRLIAEGFGDSEIARLTHIPRETVRGWRSAIAEGHPRRPRGDLRCSRSHDFSTLPYASYGYLLGMYLGDGYIAEHRRGVTRLRICGDVRYPAIIEECATAMETVMSGQSAYRLVRKGCIEVSMYSKHWPCLFPQHGKGRKHDREIRLEEWQEALLSADPRPFLRGLIHSDGCRITANDRGVASVRYHFSNRSEDIKTLFTNCLDQIGVTWTRPSDREIAVYRKEAVALLDEFIGPKK